MAEKKLISWNVNGIRACIGKGFSEAFAALDADILCLQETKVQAGQVDFAPEGYHCYWNYAEKKGYSGTAVFSREEPLSVSYGIGIPEHDREGRVITLGFEKFYFVCVYTPNSQDGLARLDYRMTWEDAFRDYLLSLDRDKPVIVCGDMNVAHNEIDLKNPKTNRKNPGFTDEERSKMTELLSAGFTDTFRYFYPDVEGSTAGGATASNRASGTRAGASTIFSAPSGSTAGLPARKYIRRYSAPTIVRSS